jgi:hypothetical protein
MLGNSQILVRMNASSVQNKVNQGDPLKIKTMSFGMRQDYDDQ